MKKIIFSILLIILLFLCPVNTSAAEVLQIANSSTLLIGDNNRNYKIRLSCLSVDPADEELAIKFLQSELPRHTKVNLHPKGSEDGILIAEIIKIGSKIDLTDEIISKGIGTPSCY